MAKSKCLGLPLDQTYDELPVARRNANQAQMFRGRLRKILQREGADIKVLAMFYRLVVQRVLMFV